MQKEHMMRKCNYIQKYRIICPVKRSYAIPVMKSLKAAVNESNFIKNLSEFFAEKQMKFRNEILARDFYGRET